MLIRTEFHPVDEEAVRAKDGETRRHRVQQVRDVPVVLPLEVDWADVPQLVGEGEEEGGALTVVQDEALPATTILFIHSLVGVIRARDARAEEEEGAVAVRPPRAEAAGVHEVTAVGPPHVHRPHAAEVALGEDGKAVGGAVRKDQGPVCVR